MNDSDLIALIDACLDDKKNMHDMVEEVRSCFGWKPIREVVTTVQYALSRSRHASAKAQLESWQNRFKTA